MVASTASLNIEVKSTGVSKAENRLKGVTTQGKKTEAQVIRLQDRFKTFSKNASASVAAVDGPLGGVASRLSALTTVATAGGVAVTALAVATTGLIFTLQKGVRVLDGYNVELAKTEAILKATGFAAGVTAKELQDEAQAIAFSTLASVEGIQQAQAVLLTFNTVQGDVRKNAVELAQDLATVFGGTAASQATQLGKALQDPIKGISALSRVGVTFNDTQKEQIRLLQESGDVMAAQSIVIQTLKEQVGGSGESVAKDSLAGKLDTAGQLFSNFAARLSEVSGVYQGALNFFDGVNSKLGEFIELLADPNLQEIRGKIQENLEAIADQQKKLEDTTDRRTRQSILRRIRDLKKQNAELLEDERLLTEKIKEEEEKKIEAVKSAENKKAEIRQQARDKEFQEIADIDAALAKSIGELAKKTADDTAAAYDRLGDSVSVALGGITEATAAFAGEQSTAYKAAFALSKAFAVSSATLNFGLALSQAMADPSALTLPQKLANYTAVASTGGQLLSTIAGVKYSGRQQGGQAVGGQPIMVGERGPELFVPQSGGSIVNNNQLRNSGSGETSITIVNQTTGRIDNVERQQITRNDVILIIQETVPSEISNTNSRTSKALRANTNSSRRLT